VPPPGSLSQVPIVVFSFQLVSHSIEGIRVPTRALRTMAPESISPQSGFGATVQSVTRSPMTSQVPPRDPAIRLRVGDHQGGRLWVNVPTWIGAAQFHLSCGGMMENVADWKRYGR
jgi:hypothetical protein